MAGLIEVNAAFGEASVDKIIGTLTRAVLEKPNLISCTLTKREVHLFSWKVNDYFQRQGSLAGIDVQIERQGLDDPALYKEYSLAGVLLAPEVTQEEFADRKKKVWPSVVEGLSITRGKHGKWGKKYYDYYLTDLKAFSSV